MLAILVFIILAAGYTDSLFAEVKLIPEDTRYKSEPSDEVFVSINGAELKENSNSSAKTLDKLPIGTLLKVVPPKPTVAEVIGSIDEAWYKVQTVSKQPRTGYMWGGNFTKGALKGDHNGDGVPDLLLVQTTQAAVQDPKAITGRVVAKLILLQGAKDIASSEVFNEPIVMAGEALRSGDFELSELQSGKLFQPPIKLFAPSAWHGGLSGPTLFAFYKGQFIKGPNAFSMSDGGSSTETFIFPDDPSGIVNHVLVRQVIENQERRTYQSTKGYQWTGSGFVQKFKSDHLFPGKGCPEADIVSMISEKTLLKREIRQGGKSVQTIYDASISSDKAEKLTGWIHVEDYNFDGCFDFKDSLSHEVFLLDMKLKKFIKHDALSAFEGDLSLNTRKKELTADVIEYGKEHGCVWRRNRFRWEKGSLNTIAELNCARDPNAKVKEKPYLCVKSSLANGILSETMRSLVSCEESEKLRDNDALGQQ